MKISRLTKTLFTVMVLPVCGTALTAGAVQLETVFNAVQEQPAEATSEESAPSTEPENVQILKVDDSVAGWNEADPSGELGLGQGLRSNWVMLNSEGNLSGNVLSSGDGQNEAKVFFIQNGRLISETASNEKGQFAARGLDQGSYTVCVHSGEHYAISGLVVLAHDAQSKNLQTQLNVSVSDDSTLAIYQLITQRASNVGFRDFGEFAFGETAEDPARLYGVKGLTAHKPAAKASTTTGNYRVSMTADGSFIGRLHAIQSSTSRPIDLKSSDVVILQNGEVIHSTQTNMYGIFRVSGLAAGYYSLVSAGPDGVLVSGFELVGGAQEATVADNADPSVHFVTVQDEETAPAPIGANSVQIETQEESAIDVPAPAADQAEMKSIEEAAPATPAPTTPIVEATNSFDGCLAPREDIGWINNYMLENRVYEEVITSDILPNDFAGCPMMGDGCCGGDFGGAGGFGGGGGGFGGLGLGGGIGGNGLALPLAAAAIAAVAASDDNNFYRAPVPISPFK